MPPLSRSEEADDYCAIVARLNDSWRVIAGSCGIQWVLQHGYPDKNHGGMRWRGRSFCRTREALIRLCRAQKAGPNVGPIDPVASAILDALPERFPEKRLNNDDPVQLAEAV